MSTVNECIKQLKLLKKAGYGTVELIAVDSRSGVSSSVDIGLIHTKCSYNDAGTLCDWPDGKEYVVVHLDH